MTNEEIRAKLFAMQDKKIQEFSAKLTPGEQNIIGIRVPLVKQLAKEIAKGDYAEYLSAPYTAYHEECLLWGSTLGNIKTEINTLLNYIDKWLPCVNNWAVCDCSVATMKELGKPKNRDIVWNYLLKILGTTNNPYAKRFCYVAMFSYFLDGEYTAKVADIYAVEDDEHYYIRMAIAWGISVILVKNYAVGLDLLQSNKLPVWTHNKAIQKARESFRITYIQKTELNCLKR